MILSLLVASALAQDAPEEETTPDPLSRYRTPFDVLVERAIGTASQPVEFNWRRTRVHVGGVGSQYFELNNFNSLRSGGVVRFPTQGLIVELGVGYVWVWDTPSSELLALTPYRQPGRPRRIEIDASVGYPIAEGVVTTVPRWFPAAQMVFNAYGGLRYALYPTSFTGLRAREIGAALVNPAISQEQIDNLEDKRLDAMQIDPARYHTLIGFGNDIYLKQGLFISPRVMMAIPLVSAAAGSQLYFWADLSLTVGVAL